MNLDELKCAHYGEEEWIAPETRAYVTALEEQCTCYGYACQHLRYLMGLDNTKEDLSECLEKFRAIETKVTDWQKLVESIIDNCLVTEAHVNRYRQLSAATDAAEVSQRKQQT